MVNNITFCILVCVLSLPACSVGVNFVKPSEEKIRLEITTKDEIIKMLGEASNVTTVKNDEFETETLTYVYASMNGLSKAVRGVTYSFHNNILVGKCYRSTYKEDNTNYDLDKAKTIKKGISFNDVVAVLGKPHCEFVYPAIEKKGYIAYQYGYVNYNNRGSEENSLTIEIDENNIVQSVEKVSAITKL